MSWDFRLGHKGDAVLAMSVKGWGLALGVNNLANRMPPRSPQAFTDNNEDVATYSPIGRLMYHSFEAKF